MTKASPGEGSVCQYLTGCCDSCIRNVICAVMKSGRNVLHHFVYLLDFLQRLKLLKPTGYVMHQQFNIQQLYGLPTLYLCVLYLSENKQRLVSLTA